MSSFAFLAALAAVPVALATQGRGFPDCSRGPLANNSICDTSLDPLARATALISLLTIEEKMNNTGSTAPGVPRIGLPAYTWWNEGLHGVAYSPGVDFANSGNFSYATSFPQPILMGAAFDDELIEAVATVVSTEARAFNNDGRAGLGECRMSSEPHSRLITS
jgi:beta-D-xylosidase 4